MLTFHWLLTVAAVAIAAVALVRARRANKRLERLTETYWELRYDFTRLRSQVARLDPGEAGQSEPAAPPAGQMAFVPLSSVRKKP